MQNERLLSKREALRLSVKMWIEMILRMKRSNKHVSKALVLNVYRNYGYEYPPENSCFCCQYARNVSRNKPTICYECPVKEWAEKADECHNTPPCMRSESPYFAYTKSADVQKTIEACRQLIALFEKNLADLPENEDGE